MSTSPIQRGTSPLSFSHRQVGHAPAASPVRMRLPLPRRRRRRLRLPPHPPLRSRSPMELRGGPRGAAPGPRSCAAAGPARARHGGLLPPPLRRLPPELRRWPSAPHPPSCAGAGRRPSPAPSAASADGGARRGGEGVICIYAPLSQQAQSTLDPTWRST